MSNMEFAGKVAWVTGAARGIGADTAARLSAEGASVFRSDLSFPADSSGDQSSHDRLLDVRDREGTKALVGEIMEAHGRLDIVVANAGVCPTSEPVGSFEQ